MMGHANLNVAVAVALSIMSNLFMKDYPLNVKLKPGSCSSLAEETYSTPLILRLLRQKSTGPHRTFSANLTPLALGKQQN